MKVKYLFGFINNDLQAVWPEIFLVTSILGLIIYGVIIATCKERNHPLANTIVFNVCILTLGSVLILILFTPVESLKLFHSHYIHDNLSKCVKSLIVSFSIVCLLTSKTTIENLKLYYLEYYVLVLFSILGALLIVSSYDFIFSFLGLEMMSLSFYVLAAFNRTSAVSTEAGLKYYLLGSFASLFLIFGFSFIYDATGSTNFQVALKFFSTGIQTQSSFKIALVLILVGVLFKLSAAPFHMWSPDVYSGSPTSSTILFAVIPKIAVFVLFYRLFYCSLNSFIGYWDQIVLFSACFSVIIGSFVPLVGKSLKRILAYSAINHVGFILLAFCTGTNFGITAVFYYLVVYMINTVCIWSLAIALELGVLKSKTNNMELSDLCGIFGYNATYTIIMSVGFFSLAGLPPLVGFLAKFWVFFSAIHSSMYTISSILILINVISAFYYIRMVKLVMFDNVKKNSWKFHKPITQVHAYIIGISVLFLILLFCKPVLLCEFIVLMID